LHIQGDLGREVIFMEDFVIPDHWRTRGLAVFPEMNFGINGHIIDYISISKLRRNR
jgi:hypothetical protein